LKSAGASMLHIVPPFAQNALNTRSTATQSRLMWWYARVSKRDLDTWCECCHDTVQCCKCVERCRSTRKPKALQNATTSVSASEPSLSILPVILYGPPSIKIVTLRSLVHYKVDRCGRTTCRSPVASVCAIYFNDVGSGRDPQTLRKSGAHGLVCERLYFCFVWQRSRATHRSSSSADVANEGDESWLTNPVDSLASRDCVDGAYCTMLYLR
jgi:hypothetical protein